MEENCRILHDTCEAGKEVARHPLAPVAAQHGGDALETHARVNSVLCRDPRHWRRFPRRRIGY